MNKYSVSVFLVLLIIQCEPSGDNIEEITPNIEINFEKYPDIEGRATIHSLNNNGEGQYEIACDTIGHALFLQYADTMVLQVSLFGMLPGSSKAVHIHHGTLNSPGRHWNQQSLYAFCDSISLGQPWRKPFAGDIGNVHIDEDGTGSLTVYTDLWALNSGDKKDILGKVVIVHDNEEDFELECQPDHPHNHDHNNLKIGGGIILLVSDITITIPDFTMCE